jgi:hypothetical protein
MKIIGNSNGWEFSECDSMIDLSKAEDILSCIPDTKIMKQASSGGTDILKAFAKALEGMGIKANIDIGELLKRLSSESMEKTASEKNGSREDTVKIASKKVEDSHYFIDVSKDTVTKKGKSLILVSAYMREGYLGRYMIKRNYFFLPDNNSDAEDTFGELTAKANKIKRRYYDDKIGVNEIFTEMKAAMDAARGDLEFEDEERAGTTVYRSKETGHDLAGPPYIGRS